MEYLLGIDLGTSSLKTVLVDPNGRVAASSVQSYPHFSPSPGYSEQRPADWIDALKRCMRELGGGKIAAIGITGQMHGLVAIDEEGIPLGNAVLWSDRRCEPEIRKLEEAFSIAGWTRMTGSRPNVSFTLGKLLWMRTHEPDRFAKTSLVLNPKDYLRYWLTGEKATDESDASGTLLFDIKEKSWSSTIMEAFQIKRDMLPPVFASTGVAGVLTDSAAASLGLHPGIPVVCGAGDAECQAIGSGVVRPGEWLCTIGTSGQIFTSIGQPRTDSLGRIHTMCHGVPGSWHIMGATLSAGLSMQWFIRRMLRLEGEQVYDTLLEEARLSVPGANGLLYLPYLLGERTPHMDNHAAGAFLGLQYDHDRGDMVRAIMEGVLFSLKNAVDVIVGLEIDPPRRLVLTGGVFENRLWREIAAEVFGVPVELSASKSGAAYGAAMLAAVGTGWFATVQDAVSGWIAFTDTIEPDFQAKHVYDELYSMYLDAYPLLRNVNRRA